MDSPALPTENGVPPQSLGRRSARGAVALLGAQIFRVGLQLVSQLTLVRLLDPESFGVVAMVAPIWGFVLIFADLGLSQAIVQRANITNAQLSTLFWVAAALTGALTVLMLLAAPLLAWLYSDARVSWIAASLALLIFISGLSIVPKAILTRQMKFGVLSFIDMFSAISAVFVGIAFAWLEYGYWALVFAQAASSIVSLVLIWIFARWLPTFALATSETKSLLHFGVNVSGVNLAVHVTGTFDNVLVGTVFGSVALGLYDRGYTLVSMPLTQFIMPIGHVTVPLLSRLLPSDKSYRDTYLTALQILLLVVVPGSAFGIAMHSSVVAILLGPRWTNAAPVVAWFFVRALVSPIYHSLSWLFVTQNRTREQVFYVTITCVIEICAVLFGLQWGVVGVACSGALSFALIQTPLLIWAATRRGAVNIKHFGGTLIPYVLAGAVSAIVLECGKSLFATLDLAALAALLVGAYSGTLLTLLCFRSSRRFLREAWKSRSIFLPGQSLDTLDA